MINPMNLLGAASIALCFFGLIVILLVVAVGFLFNVSVLWGASKLLNLKKKDFKTASFTVLYLYAVGVVVGVIQLPFKIIFHWWLINLLITVFFLAVILVVSVYIIRKQYEATWLRALAAYLILWILTAIFTFIVALILGVLAVTLVGASLKSLTSGMML